MNKIILYHQVEDNNCGPAVLRILISHHGIIASDREYGERVFAELTKNSSKYGTSAENIVAAAKKLGFESFYKDECKWRELQKEVNRAPVIVNWYLDMEKQRDGHYSVAFEVTRSKIILADPSYGVIRDLPRDQFESIWFDFKGEYPQKPSDFIARRMIVVRGPRNPEVRLPKGFMQTSLLEKLAESDRV